MQCHLERITVKPRSCIRSNLTILQQL